MVSPLSLYKPIPFMSNLFAKIFKRNNPCNFINFGSLVSYHHYIKKIGVFLLSRSFCLLESSDFPACWILLKSSFYLHVLLREIDDIV